VALKAATNNESDTVLDLFLHAVDEYGKPCHVRGDRGGENIKVAVWITEHSGTEKAAFLWGS
jgi:hypothetical protein